MPAAKPNDLYLNLRTHITERTNTYKVSSDRQVFTIAYALLHTYIHIELT